MPPRPTGRGKGLLIPRQQVRFLPGVLQVHVTGRADETASQTNFWSRVRVVYGAGLLTRCVSEEAPLGSNPTDSTKSGTVSERFMVLAWKASVGHTTDGFESLRFRN